LTAAEKEIEKLVDKLIIEGQGIARQNNAGHLLDKPWLKPGAGTLNDESFQGMWFASG
jgi:hypothetical protein